MNTKNKIEEHCRINLQQFLLKYFLLSDKIKLLKESKDKVKMSVYLRNILNRAKMLIHLLIIIS